MTNTAPEKTSLERLAEVLAQYRAWDERKAAHYEGLEDPLRAPSPAEDEERADIAYDAEPILEALAHEVGMLLQNEGVRV